MYKLDFLRWCRERRNLSEGTCKEYRKDLLAMTATATELGINKHLSELSLQELEATFEEMHKRGLKPATINRRLATARSYFHYLEKREIIWKNPTNLLDNEKKGEKLPKVIDAETVREFLNRPPRTLETVTAQALVALLASTGLRISEALKLEGKDINKQQNGLRIHGKGNKERMVYYNDAAKRLLNQYTSYTKWRGGKIFDIDYMTAYNLVTNNLRDKDGRGVNPHQLRHLFASASYEAGIELKTISKMLGHSSVRTTEIYTQVSPMAVRNGYQQLNIFN